MTAVRLSRDAVLMGTAHLFAQRGTCARAQVGAVVSRGGRVLVTGYNGAPAGMEHCYHPFIMKFDETTQISVRVFTDEKCDVSVHAEANAVAWAARLGIPTQDAQLHTTVSPCLACAQILINAGITRVVYEEKYRLASGLILLKQAGVQVEEFNPNG